VRGGSRLTAVRRPLTLTTVQQAFERASEPVPSDGTDESPPPLPLRDPQALLERTLAARNPRHDLWVFGYASLIWRPEFHAAEQRPARVHGFHRALQMRSRLNRGTPERPGLVCRHGLSHRA